MKIISYLSLALAMAALWFSFSPARIQPSAQSIDNVQTTYDRVMQSGALRCGYSLRYPFMMKDPNTGALSGVSYDYMEALGKKLSLKIEWAVETGNAEMVTDLKSGKYDAFCTAIWPTSARARDIDFIYPIGRMPVYAFVRSADTRFDQDYQAMNQDAIRFAVIDGHAPTQMVETLFPSAQKVSLPELSTPEDLIQHVLHDKADVFVGDVTYIDDFRRKHGDVIRQVALPPLAEMPLSVSIPGNNYRMQRMLSLATAELINNGTMKMIFQKYDVDRLTPILQANP